MAETRSQDSIPLAYSPSAVVIALEFYFLNTFSAFFFVYGFVSLYYSISLTMYKLYTRHASSGH
ncbi:hypothetical protein BD560DRAFT_416794 [Blakeslea trispora]|nr:hypothetical protein BD560DRAFT_416794 [Blakeslea trispora]